MAEMTSLSAAFATSLRHCRVEVSEPIATITLDRPERLNALHPPAHHELSQLFDRLQTDSSLRVIIITGAGGKAFCAGYDLKDNVETGRFELPKTGFAGFNDRQNFPIPVIAAVNGVAFGGGFELALDCDIIIAARSARFALPEPKVGWAALGGGVQRLPQAIGLKRAMDIILTGRSVDAEEALSLHLVSEVVEGGALLPAARRWAEQIVDCAPLAIKASRMVAAASAGTGWRGRAELDAYPIVQEMLQSEDAVEGKRAFVEGRKPIWRGK
jgi:crotonobetainyl-CoA hydratase